MVRRLLSASFNLLITLGAAAWLIHLLLFNDRIAGIQIVAACAIVVFGAKWLWSDLSETWSKPKDLV